MIFWVQYRKIEEGKQNVELGKIDYFLFIAHYLHFSCKHSEVKIAISHKWFEFNLNGQDNLKEEKCASANCSDISIIFQYFTRYIHMMVSLQRMRKCNWTYWNEIFQLINFLMHNFVANIGWTLQSYMIYDIFSHVFK